MSKLFREQAALHQRQRLHGSIVLRRPASYAALTMGACLVCAAVLAFLCLCSVSRTERASGLLLPDRGLLGLTAPQAGIATEVRVRTDQRVSAGQILFVLSSEKASAAGDTQLAISNLLDQRVTLLRDEGARLIDGRENELEALRRRAEELGVQLSQLEAEIAVQERRVALVRNGRSRLQDLKAEGFASQAQLDRKEVEALEEEARLHGLQRTAAGIRGQLADVGAQRHEVPLRTARELSQLHRQIDELRQEQAENEAQRQVVVRAPRAGQLAGVQVRAGQAVTANAMLASLVPEGSHLQAELSVPSRGMGFVRRGTPVLLRYDAYPYQLFGQHHGTVIEIDRSRGADADAGTQRVVVKLDSPTVSAAGQTHTLQPGLKVEATLITERRRLIELVLDPLKQLTTRA